jgi:endonuclease YncB( thermonuclease family)
MPVYTYDHVTVLQVHDGDTFWALIDLGLRITTSQKIRVRGVNAPELPTPEGNASRDWLKALLPPGTLIRLVSHSWTYDRLECDVTLADKTDLAAAMVLAGVAVPAHRE